MVFVASLHRGLIFPRVQNTCLSPKSCSANLQHIVVGTWILALRLWPRIANLFSISDCIWLLCAFISEHTVVQQDFTPEMYRLVCFYLFSLTFFYLLGFQIKGSIHYPHPEYSVAPTSVPNEFIWGSPARRARCVPHEDADVTFIISGTCHLSQSRKVIDLRLQFSGDPNLIFDVGFSSTLDWITCACV